MNATLPLVSAIMPVFNKAQYIIEAVGSLVRQNYPQLELVVVDDGSTDNSWSVIQSISDHYPLLNIRPFQKANGGASDARNFAIQHSSGELIVNMDADDIMTDGFLLEAVALVLEKEADVVYSDLELFGDHVGEWIPQPFDPFYIRYDNCVPSLALFKKALWHEVGGYDVALPFSEDWNFFVAISRYSTQFHKIPRKAFRYRQTGNGLYNSYIREAWEWGSGLLMCAQDDLYPVGDVLRGMDKLAGMPERWVKKFEQFSTLHPVSWLPPFLCGLVSERSGNIQQATHLYQVACARSELGKWLPLFKLSKCCETSDLALSLEALHRVRTLRADMAPLVHTEIMHLNSLLTARAASQSDGRSA